MRIARINYFSKQESDHFYINSAKVERKGEIQYATAAGSKSNRNAGRERVNNFKSIIDQKL